MDKELELKRYQKALELAIEALDALAEDPEPGWSAGMIQAGNVGVCRTTKNLIKGILAGKEDDE